MDVGVVNLKELLDLQLLNLKNKIKWQRKEHL